MGIVDDLRSDADISEAGEYPEDGCRWAITMRRAADRIDKLEIALHQIAGHGNITGDRARQIACDALAIPKTD